MKIMMYSTSWCAVCQSMAEFIKQQYPSASMQFVPVDRMPADVQEKILAHLRTLTWSNQLPVTVIDDTVVLGTDYAALIVLLGPSHKSPSGGSTQHRHGLAETAA